jgi:hypothetical protein
MAAVKTKLGRIPCDCCGHSVWVKENEGGTLTIACDECDVNMIAKKGTAAQKRWRAKLPKLNDESSVKSLPGAAPGKVPSQPPAVPKKPPAAPPDALPVPNKPANPLDFFMPKSQVAA